ncbi:hypothetical protein NL676_001934 [Syzygium grande]|nr:hypothetical protein NL676_001934 [Syzygium grande]
MVSIQTLFNKVLLNLWLKVLAKIWSLDGARTSDGSVTCLQVLVVRGGKRLATGPWPSDGLETSLEVPVVREG